MSLERLVQSRFLRPIVTGVLASIIGCASPTGGKGLREACGNDSECSGQYVCDAKKCVGSSGASCGNDYDCSSVYVCEQGMCVVGSGSGSRGKADGYSGSGKDSGIAFTGTPWATQKSIGGVGITSGTTNSNGQVAFIDSGNKEIVMITVNDKNNSQAVGEAGVTFLDGNGFELFQVYKPGYVPALGVYAHNSEHEITLVNENYNTLTIWEYYQNKNPDEYYALDKYVQWAGNNYLYSGCYTKEEMKKADEWGMTGVSYIFGSYIGGAAAKGFLSVINTVLDKLSWAEKNGLFEKYPDDVYQVYQAVNFTGPQHFKGMSMSKEICNDGIDNDCDKYIDGKDSDCKTTSNCTSHAITVCNNNNVQWKDSCGKLEEVVKMCSTSQTCENSQCVDKKPICTPQYSKICSNGDVYWQDSCGNLGSMAQDCTSNQTCESGKCVATLQFIDLGDGTVKDTKTGNIWQKNAAYENWDNANTYCNNLTLGGSNNWSLPSLQNLKSMLATNDPTTCSIPNMLDGGCGDYWTSEDCTGIQSYQQYMTVHFNLDLVPPCKEASLLNRVRCLKK